MYVGKSSYPRVQTTKVCAEFGISRKTGYKIFDRYKDEGLQAFTDRSRRPVSAGESVARAGGSDDRSTEARISRVGCTQNPRETGEADRGDHVARNQHGARGAGPASFGAAPASPTPPDARDGALDPDHPLVR